MVSRRGTIRALGGFLFALCGVKAAVRSDAASDAVSALVAARRARAHRDSRFDDDRPRDDRLLALI